MRFPTRSFGILTNEGDVSAAVHAWGTAGECPLSKDRRRCALGRTPGPWQAVLMDFLPDSVNGLPLHPLVVHAPVVLVPLSGVLALLMVVLPRFSQRFGPLVAVLAWAAAGSAYLAKQTGELLREEIGRVSRLHVDSGEVMPYFAVGQAGLITVLWWADRRGGRGILGMLVALLTVVAALAAGYWVYRTGDSGARSVWR